MKENVFKKIETENEILFLSKESEINGIVKGRKDFWDFIGEILELYMPKLFSTVVGRDASGIKDSTQL